MVETETYTIEGPDGDEDTVELPAGLVDVLSEQGEQPTEVVGDILLLSFVQRAHAIVHHSEGETPQDLAEINEKGEELFEERFGMTLAEATGHSH
ncbi:hypothetical protein AUR64_10550 [Haloprofundus marisrubri]|uniref:Uncharacterized protein n=1 Tax=Haloprofundus marisrubri TaxID=1514971 RepID=A0A0W1R9I7_9EURY|nr:hypothetical protein [Haloprofundus marisrubri]KTG10033.1 hypothetical protein AUR64_10550 [Haloprofundus marisrubri]